MSPIIDFARWTIGLPEPLGLLIVGAVWFFMSAGLKRLHTAPPVCQVPTPIKRRIQSATRLAAQRGHS